MNQCETEWSAAGIASTAPLSGSWKPTRYTETSDACSAERIQLEMARHTAVIEPFTSVSRAACSSRLPGNRTIQLTKMAIQTDCTMTSAARKIAFDATYAVGDRPANFSFSKMA